MHRAHRIRLNPTQEQEQYFWRCAGVARFTWNWALGEYNAALARGEKPLTGALRAEFNRRRREDGFAPFVGEVQSYAYQYAFQDLQYAIDRYYQFKKAGKLDPTRHKPRKDGQPFGWPRFKTRAKAIPAFGLHNHSGIRCRGHWARIQRCPGPVNMAEELRFDGRVLGARVSYTGGHWYLAVYVEMPDPALEPRPGAVGVDFGIKSLAVTSDGTVYENPQHLQASERKIKRLNRELSRRTKGGKNWHKTKAKLSKEYARVRDQRRETLHQMTTDLVSHYGTIVIEDLNVLAMLKNHKLAHAIADASFAMIRKQLEYKAPARGGRVIVVDRFYPSSKTCNDCGHKVQLTLADRTWVCPNCGVVHDRDLNAARNLRDYAGTA